MRGAKRLSEEHRKEYLAFGAVRTDGRAVRGKLADGSEHCAKCPQTAHSAVCTTAL